MNNISKYFLISVLVLIFAEESFAQPEKSKDTSFIPPVDFPLYLTGTFGELRSNHFHAGIDIKTQGVEGKKILAIADGWVSRIKISTGGYGKAIYITHHNGYVSVYGHLQKFNNSIQEFVIYKQYEKESYTFQTFPEKDQIQVKKGDVIGYSGNTGSSMGPHLHFEIREEKSQYPVNPLLFSSFKVKDFYRPKITEMAIYPVDNNSTINGKNDTVFFEIEGWGEEHRLKGDPEIMVSGRISFGISTYDLMNDLPNKNGIYNLKLFYDTTLIFDLEMNKLSFSTTRYINSLIDYSHKIKSKTRIVRTQIDTNNQLNNYLTVQNNGIIDINDTMVHSMKYEVRDVYNNTSKLKFNIVGIENNSEFFEQQTTDLYINFSKKNSIKEDSIQILFPANSFYRSFYFDFDKLGKDNDAFSSTYKIHSQYIPVHKNFTIKIIPDLVSPVLQSKIYISYSPDNSTFYFNGKEKEGKYLSSKSRELGYYKIMMDTIPPEIAPVDFLNGKKITKQRTLKVKTEDKETGINSYRATLNGQWILMEYDPKKKLLVYNFDDRLKKGENKFQIIVTDMLDNESIYNCLLDY